MARKVVYQLVDDIDGTELIEGEGETVLFSLDGTNYEIDLSTDHARLLRAGLEKYIAVARTVAKNRGSGRSGGQRAPRGPKRDLTAIRNWANANGYTVSDRGRVPNAVIEAYDAAQGK